MKAPINLTDSQIARLVRHHKLEPGPTSPLSGIGDPGGTRENDGGDDIATDNEHSAAFMILAAPNRLSRIVLPQVRQTSTLLFYAASQARKAPLVGFTRRAAESDGGDGLWELAPQVALSDLVTLARQNTDEPMPAAEPSSFELGLHGMMAMAAAIDTVRAGMAADFLGRRIVETPEYQRADVEGFFAEGIAHHDPRWLVSAIRLLLPPGVSTEDVSIADGYAELRDMWLVRESGPDSWQATPVLLSLAQQFASPLPATAITTVYSDKTGLIVRRGHHAIVAMAGPAHHFDMTRLAADPSAKVTIRRLGRGQLKPVLDQALLAPAKI